MKSIRKYHGRYGVLIVDFENHEIIEDTLNRKRIWRDSGESYYHQSIIYSEIIDALNPQDFSTLVEEDEFWAGDSTDFGFECYLDDGWVLLVDAEESNFYRRKE